MVFPYSNQSPMLGFGFIFLLHLVAFVELAKNYSFNTTYYSMFDMHTYNKKMLAEHDQLQQNKRFATGTQGNVVYKL